MPSAKGRFMAVTIGVWLVAAGSAAALAYELNRPLTESKPEALADPGSSVARPSRADDAAMGPTDEGYSPSDSLATNAHRRARGSRPAPRTARDLSAMNCGPWRDLDIGSGQVQTCQ